MPDTRILYALKKRVKPSINCTLIRLLRYVRSDKSVFWQNVLIVFSIVAVLWVLHFIQHQHIYDFSAYANHPRHIEGLKGIIFSPLLHDHKNSDHIISNTLPLLVLLMVLLSAYPRMALWVLLFVHFASGILVWLLAPDHTYHVGSSGVVYGLAGFLVAAGLFRKDRTSVSIAILVALVYGGMVAGFLPKQGVSWQSHLYGALSGAFMAFLFRKRDLPPPHEIELETIEKDRHFFEELEERQQQNY